MNFLFASVLCFLVSALCFGITALLYTRSSRTSGKTQQTGKNGQGNVAVVTTTLNNKKNSSLNSISDNEQRSLLDDDLGPLLDLQQLFYPLISDKAIRIIV